MRAVMPRHKEGQEMGSRSFYWEHIMQCGNGGIQTARYGNVFRIGKSGRRQKTAEPLSVLSLN